MSTKPDDISQEALNAAEALTNEWFFLDRHSGAAQAIARAIMAAEKRGEERERAACEEIAAIQADADGNPDMQWQARIIRDAIRKRGV